MNFKSVLEQTYHVFSWQINLAGTSGRLRQCLDPGASSVNVRKPEPGFLP